MKVYELQYIDLESVTTMGFFSSLKKRDEAVEKLRKTEGFSEHPNNFATFEHSMYDGKAVYHVRVFFGNEEADFSYSHTIGYFAREADADNAAQNFIARNRGKLEPDELEIEIAVDTYKLDELQLEEE